VIDRFNFYDIYGYLLPGVLLFALIWLPLGLLTGMWPPAEWSSAILVLALAYVVGHILHSLSDAALPFEFKDKKGNKRAPSDLLLDNDKDQVLTKDLGDLREKLDEQIEDDFKIDVKAGSAWDKQLIKPRLNAFLLCRNLLIRQKAAGYAEQQQGMYVLMRGAAAALLFSCTLYAGMGMGLSIFCFLSMPSVDWARTSSCSFPVHDWHCDRQQCAAKPTVCGFKKGREGGKAPVVLAGCGRILLQRLGHLAANGKIYCGNTSVAIDVESVSRDKLDTDRPLKVPRTRTSAGAVEADAANSQSCHRDSFGMEHRFRPARFNLPRGLSQLRGQFRINGLPRL
jgi:hypothetical protein